MTEYAFEGAKRSSTSIGWSFATQNFFADSTTPFESQIGGAYQATILAAFARWASVSGLTFTQMADAQDVPIRIGFGTFVTDGELGETDFRIANGALADDTLIRLLDPVDGSLAPGAAGYTYDLYGATLLQVVLHEIGHALGLDHTTDPYTIMYPYATTLNADLAVGDIEGIDTLYPLFSLAAANPLQAEGGPGQVDAFSVVVTRYGDPSAPLTMDYAVTGAADPALRGSVAAGADAFLGGAFPSGQITFAAGATTATLTVQTVGNAVPQPDQGFAITLSTGEARDGIIVQGNPYAAVLDDDTAPVGTGSLSLYRFFGTVDGTQFLTDSLAERNTVLQTRPDLLYEGQTLHAVATPSADPAAAPVFRFFDTGSGTHFYTIDATERATVIATRPDLVSENVGFYEHVTAQPGDAAVYRFFETRGGTHFYTSSADERATILATRPDMVDEGLAFYAPSA